MAVQTVTPVAHTAEAESTTANMTTLAATGAGNGFQFAFTNISLIVLYNDSGAAATATIKTNQPAKYADRSLTIPDETVSLADGAAPKTVLPNTIFKDASDKITIEADQLIKIKVFKLFEIE